MAASGSTWPMRATLQPFLAASGEDDARLPQALAWARVALTGLCLTATPLLPGLDGNRLQLAFFLLVIWLPAALAQVAIVPLRQGNLAVARLASAALDVTAVGAFLLALPRMATAHLLAMLLFVGLHAVIDTFVGGILVTLLGSLTLTVAITTGQVPRLEPLDIAVFLLAGIATTALVGYGSQTQRRSAHAYATSYARARDQLSLALAAAETGLWEWDVAHDHIDWSAGTLRIFGQDEPPPDVEAFIELLHPDDRVMLQQRVQAALLAGGSYQVQHRIVVNGRTRWLIGKGRAFLDEAGKPVRLLGVVTDVTDQHDQQVELERSRRMETVSGLAGGFAHDFNNLLAVIMMSAEMQLRSVLDDAQRERAKVILEAAQRGAALSSKLLTFARRESGHPSAIQLHALVHAVEPMLRHALRADVTLTIDVPPTLPAILADRTLLEQALLNLAVNARDAIVGAGAVTIRARAEVGQPAGLDMVLLQVIDSGVGMTDEVRDRAMEPFFTTKGPDRGTGLGLASVYATVTAIGGSVEIDSAPGQGTVVSLRLPITAESPRSDVGAGIETPDSTGRNILVVDDDARIRVVLSELLSSMGHRVTCAEDGQAALKLLESANSPDLLLTDVVMPGMSGPDLVEQMQRGGRNVPVLYMTGYVDQDDELPELTPVLRKPFTSASLTDAVGSALGSHRT